MPAPLATRWKDLKERYQKARERRWFRWAVDLAVLALLVGAVGAWQTRNLLGRGAPVELTLSALEGAPVSFASLRGKPTLVVFWAPWCGVCKSISGNVGWARKLAGDRAHVVSIAASYAELRQVQGYVRDHGVDYPVLLGSDAELEAFHVAAFPTLYFLDREGRVKSASVGYTTTAGLLARLLL